MNVDTELENILKELDRLSETISQKEIRLDVEKVKELYLEQAGTENFILQINEKKFDLSTYDLAALLEQMQEVGLFSKLASYGNFIPN